MRWKIACAAGFCATALPIRVASEEIVGFSQPVPGAYVAVRWTPERNATVSGITFFSNDNTVFPEVVLATDGGSSRLPSPAAVLRSVVNVRALRGATTVLFEPYSVGDGDGSLWVVIRFPLGETVSAEGVGGGAGIGWVVAPPLREQRSFFGGDESINELTVSFDVSVESNISSSKVAATAGATGDDAASSPADGFRLSVVRSRRGVCLQTMLSGGYVRDVAIFDVLGRRIRRLADGSGMVSGSYRWEWDGAHTSGQRVASGVYFAVVTTSCVTLRRKFALVR